MYKVALFHPWDLDFFYDQTPGGHGDYEDFQFIINDDSKPVDFCVVWGGLPGKSITIKCPPGNLIYMTDEAHAHRFFNQGFLNQFDAVIACRTDIRHKKVIQTHETNTWHMPYTRDELYNDDHIQKTKLISLIASDLTILPGHKKRYAFVNKLIGHFKGRLDVYGRGFNDFTDKMIGLKEYKYSIAIENSAIPGYFTEKLSECYLANCMPIYYGAPDITDYFDKESMLRIDIDDYVGAINAIEQLLAADPYEDKKELLIRQKHTYLNKYHLYPGLIKILKLHFNTQLKDGFKKRRLKPEYKFEKYYLLKKITGSIRKKLLD